VKERIREGNLRHWRGKTRQELLTYAENARLRWDLLPAEQKRRWTEECRARWWSRPDSERAEIIEKVRQAKLGVKRLVPVWNRGLTGWNRGHRKSPETRRKMSLAARQVWAQRKQKEDVRVKKPPTSVKASTEYQRQQINAADRKQTGFTGAFNGTPLPRQPAQIVRMPYSRTRSRFAELSKECVAAIQLAYETLEAGRGDIGEPKRELKRVLKELDKLQSEYEGACTW